MDFLVRGSSLPTIPHGETPKLTAPVLYQTLATATMTDLDRDEESGLEEEDKVLVAAAMVLQMVAAGARRLTSGGVGGASPLPAAAAYTRGCGGRMPSGFTCREGGDQPPYTSAFTISIPALSLAHAQGLVTAADIRRCGG